MTKSIVTQDELKKQLYYDCNTGLFYKNNKEHGSKEKDGYVYVYVNRKRKLAHRLAFLYVYGYFPDMIDHINGIKHDNRIANLRQCNSSENNCNSKISSLNKTGTRGVSFEKASSKYRVQIFKNNKRFDFGYFSNLEDAVHVAQTERIKLHKEFYCKEKRT
jgi:hypothetical protein